MMDGIQTNIYCPVCGKENEMLLERLDVPEPVREMMETIGVDCGSDHVYKKEAVCFCEKTIKVSLIIETFSESERHRHEYICGGNDEKQGD